MIEALLEKALGTFSPWCKDFLEARFKSINEYRARVKAERRTQKLQKGLSAEVLARTELDAEEFLSGTFEVSNSQIIAKLKLHTNEIERWCNWIKFRDMPAERRLRDLYIELDTFLMPQRLHMESSERANILPMREAVLNSATHCVVLGQPGAGKTTSIQKLCSTFFDGTTVERFHFPILVRFRTLPLMERKQPLLDYLRSLLAYELKLQNATTDDDTDSPLEIEREIVCALLDRMNALILLDGFDEIPSQTARDSVLTDVRALCSSLSRSKIVLTCRTGEFNYELDRCQTFEIAPLSDLQIDAFVHRWILDPQRAAGLLSAIRTSPFYDAAIKPLSLAHLCAIYERTGRIPERPKSTYKKLVWLLLEEWDEQRSISRLSQYAKFETDRKFEFLSQLSYDLATSSGCLEFFSEEIEASYLAICDGFRLPRDECKQVVREVESHTGLFIEVAYRKFAFAHKSLQEYLAAEFLVRLPNLETVREHSDAMGSSLAIATALSSQPSLYLAEIFLGMYIGEGITRTFYESFMSRLLQEKPDFSPCDEIILAALTAVSRRPDASDHEEPTTLRDHTPFREFYNWVFDACDISVVFDYFELNLVCVDSKSRGKRRGKAITIVHLTRLKHHPHYRLSNDLFIFEPTARWIGERLESVYRSVIWRRQ